jgi:transposase
LRASVIPQCWQNPRQLMAYFGLIPGEQSSGETIRRGGITKTGNAHARRALVEGHFCGSTSPWCWSLQSV